MNESNKALSAHATPPAETFDPVAEAESLKAALQEALNRSARLLGFLKQFRKHQKVVHSAVASLRQIQLYP